MLNVKCKYCQVKFEPKSANQLFCKNKCKSRWHNENSKLKGGIPAVAKSVRVLKNGGLSVTSHISPGDRARCHVLPGQTLKLIEVTQ